MCRRKRRPLRETASGSRKMKSKWFVFFFVLAGLAAVAAGQDGGIEKNIVYGTVDGVELKMDLAKPSAGSTPCPALVCIHGGAWESGSKDGYAPFIGQFAAHGYVTAAVEYRFAPKYPWPAQIEDAKCAVRYLRAHAKELNIDPDKIAALGDSAGGHLALLLGLMDPKDGLEGKGGNPGVSSKVQAVVNLFGPTDMRVWRVAPEAEKEFATNLGKGSEKMLAEFLGTADRSAPVMVLASPVTYINAGDPPILTFHGTKDPIVSIDQAKLLHAALKKAGVRERLVVMEDQGHGWPGLLLIDTIMQGLDFLDSVLKVPAPGPAR